MAKVYWNIVCKPKVKGRMGVRGIVENVKDVIMPKWVGVESFYWQIGNGRTVLFGIDIWCGLCRDDWNEFFTRSLLGREEVMRRELAKRVSGMVLISDMEDKLCWANDKNEEPPPHGWLKFNVCGVAKEDTAGYGGVLRDQEGVTIALFFSSVAANDADMAEIGAVKVALKVFLAMN
ncbi:hypothetical protein Gotri_013970 [Gossypium trilobum]|uniref:RNase H type-1 domain-containing protein n=1 Tax=Gossypium trilobum TaxID=34281 RepID=A0A7J9DVT6_9ROSI|nr:hypothetical protein [Gossypium trilobum]